MSRRLPKLWYPETSYTGPHMVPEEAGRGSQQGSSSEQELETGTQKRQVTPPTPAVNVPPDTSRKIKPPLLLPELTEGANIYKTIEAIDEDEATLLDHSSLPYQKSNTTAPNQNCPNWFCGWTEEEYFDLHRTKPPPCDTDRALLRTADGYRSTLHSRGGYARYNSTSTVRRRPPYSFHHFDSFQKYSKEYRKVYSYTALCTSHYSQKETKEEKKKNGGEWECVEHDFDTTILPIGMNNVYQKDPYLRELISRLGIREPPANMERNPCIMEGDKQQQLLRSPRPTPPSIVKRKKVENIVVSNSAPMPLQDALDNTTVHGGTSATSNKMSYKNPAGSSRPTSRRESKTDLELPKITQPIPVPQYLRQLFYDHKKKHSSSVISVNKYLCVKSKQHDTLLEEEEDKCGSSNGQNEASKDEKHSTDLSECDDDDIPVPPQYTRTQLDEPCLEAANLTNEIKKNPANVRTSEHSLGLDKAQKEKLISNTAYLLGVVSRDWAKSSSMRKNMSYENKIDSSISVNDHSSHILTCQSRSRMSSWNRTQANHDVTTVTKHANQKLVKTPPEIAQKKEKKLEELKSIYESNRLRNLSDKPHKLQLSRQASRCENRLTSRPETRLQTRPETRLQTRPEMRLHTRPETRLHTSHRTHFVREESYDGYYSGKSRPCTRMGLTLGTRQLSTRQHRQNHCLNSGLGNKGNLEGSSYWNELPKPSRPTTGRKVGRHHTEKTHVRLQEIAQPLLHKRGISGRCAGRSVGHGHSRAEVESDKMTHAITLAMRFCGPKEGLLHKKLTT